MSRGSLCRHSNRVRCCITAWQELHKRSSGLQPRGRLALCGGLTCHFTAKPNPRRARHTSSRLHCQTRTRRHGGVRPDPRGQQVPRQAPGDPAAGVFAGEEGARTCQCQLRWMPPTPPSLAACRGFQGAGERDGSPIRQNRPAGCRHSPLARVACFRLLTRKYMLSLADNPSPMLRFTRQRR